tara:strand:- start:999 stop:2870 length:1872 start_codon:yes stop_codon:yes gene_type:complete
MATITVLKRQVFVERDPDQLNCLAETPLVGISDVQTSASGTVVLHLVPGKTAAATADTIQFSSADPSEPTVLHNLEPTQHIELRHGLAPVQFGSSIDDSTGTTSVLGCACTDNNSTGPDLTCTIALPGADDDAVVVPLEFADADPVARQRHTCADLYISVQPTYDDLRGQVDALVYVMPECDMGSLACLRGSMLAFCYPFCVAVHHSGAGARALRLHRATSLEGAGRVLLHRHLLPNSTVLEPRVFSETETAPGQSGVEIFRRVTEQFNAFVSPVADVLAGVVDDVNAALDSDAEPDVPPAPLPIDLFERGFGQPYAFAGPFVLTEAQIQATGASSGLRNVTLQKITLSASNALTLDTVLTGIMVAANAVPGRSMRASQQRNLACAMPNGVLFYAINDATDNVKAILLEQYGLSSKDLGVPGALLRIDPLNSCARTASIPVQTTRWCTADLVREVDVAKEFNIVWPEGGDTLQSLKEKNESTGLFIESVQRFDAVNVLVAVRVGPIDALFQATGRIAGGTEVTRSRFYFVHAETLEVQNEAFKEENKDTCPVQHGLPPVFGLVAQVAVVQVCAVLCCVVLCVLAPGLGCAPRAGGAKFSPGLASAPRAGGVKFLPGLASAPIA